MPGKKAVNLRSTDLLPLLLQMRGNSLTHEIIIKIKLRFEYIHIIIALSSDFSKHRNLFFELCLLRTNMIFLLPQNVWKLIIWKSQKFPYQRVQSSLEEQGWRVGIFWVSDDCKTKLWSTILKLYFLVILYDSFYWSEFLPFQEFPERYDAITWLSC